MTSCQSEWWDTGRSPMSTSGGYDRLANRNGGTRVGIRWIMTSCQSEWWDTGRSPMSTSGGYDRLANRNGGTRVGIRWIMTSCQSEWWDTGRSGGPMIFQEAGPLGPAGHQGQTGKRKPAGGGHAGSGRKTFHSPSVTIAAITNAIVQPALATLPELDYLGSNAVSTQCRGSGTSSPGNRRAARRARSSRWARSGITSL